MSRRKRASQREIIPDSVYSSATIAKFINHLMQDGKKAVAEKIVYQALENALERIKKTGEKIDSATEFLEKVIEKVEPMVEVKSRRVGGSVYPVPVEVRPIRRRSLAMRWITNAARERANQAMEANLANELVDIFNDQGNALKKKAEVHRMADANKAFSHFRF